MARVLVVEDHADIAELITHYLERAGHAPEIVRTGSAVMPRLIDAPADLVLLDLMLPGMDGLLVCQAIRDDARTASTPIGMLTAKIQRHPVPASATSMIRPPTIGPRADATPMTAPMMPKANPRRIGGNISWMNAVTGGKKIPPPRP